jgi:hypothetical protein
MTASELSHNDLTALVAQLQAERQALRDRLAATRELCEEMKHSQPSETNWFTRKFASEILAVLDK